jgi:hypothetical protein
MCQQPHISDQEPRPEILPNLETTKHRVNKIAADHLRGQGMDSTQ